MDDITKRKVDKAMQKVRHIVCEKLDQMLEEAKEEVEDEIIEALVDVGIDAPITDLTSQAADEAIRMTDQCFEEAAKYWHGSKHGPVWVLVSWDPENSRSNGLEVEVFGDRPRTFDGDPRNWPDWFRVFEGNIDGGDTVRGDAKGVSFG